MADGKTKPERDCIGTLFHSQSRLDSGKEPVCAGIRGKYRGSQSMLPRESVPAGQFKYVCIGYSVYDKQKQAEGGRAVDTVELPYCEGLEVISAAELIKTPATLNEAAGGATMSGREASAQEPRSAAPAQPRPGRSFVPGGSGDGGPTGGEWDVFAERFMKTSRKVVDRMGTNLAFIGRTAKQTVDRWGRWGDED